MYCVGVPPILDVGFVWTGKRNLQKSWWKGNLWQELATLQALHLPLQFHHAGQHVPRLTLCASEEQNIRISFSVFENITCTLLQAPLRTSHEPARERTLAWRHWAWNPRRASRTGGRVAGCRGGSRGSRGRPSCWPSPPQSSCTPPEVDGGERCEELSSAFTFIWFASSRQAGCSAKFLLLLSSLLLCAF